MCPPRPLEMAEGAALDRVKWIFVRGHPGKTGIGNCTLVVAESKNASTANLAAEAPLSPDLRAPEKRNVVSALADNFKAVSINKEDTGASSGGEEFVSVGFSVLVSWPIAAQTFCSTVVLSC